MSSGDAHASIWSVYLRAIFQDHTSILGANRQPCDFRDLRTSLKCCDFDLVCFTKKLVGAGYFPILTNEQQRVLVCLK